MFPLLIENYLLGIALLSLTITVAFRSPLGPFVGALQTLVNEVVCQRVRVLIVRKVFMGLVKMLRLHSNLKCFYFYRIIYNLLAKARSK